MQTEAQAFIIHIKGLVQGVGFRPFVYRMALKNNIKGWVENNNEGVTVHAECNSEEMNRFLNDVRKLAPQASNITTVATYPAQWAGFTDFSIQKSGNLSDAVTEVSPDIAVCNDCLEDMEKQPHRLGYPFINCTHCGPRFSIIRELPYDRQSTTMAPFVMCAACNAEYADILDRRFHAQPIACRDCGPKYFINEHGKNELTDKASDILADWINSGNIVAMKGMGGYHLVCDALDEAVVSRLRNRKKREGKPVAVMIPDIETAYNYFEVSEAEADLLRSWRRPIVLLRNKLDLAHSVSLGLNTTGVMLPYMPVHTLLFKKLKTNVLVVTSGNLSDEPVAIDDDVAYERLYGIADHIMGYNREINNRADDSVSLVVNEKERIIRRSRGYVPSPISLSLDCEGIFAAGAELVNTFAIGKGTQAMLSQHIGDLKNAETLAFYEEAFERFSNLFRFRPSLIACDSHPDYLSSQFARNLGIQTIEVQHHHAHIAACMAEYGLDEPVIGIALDGTGYGSDGTIWGGEFMIADLLGFERKYFFDPVPLPGGDRVTAEPWRTALSYLYKYFGPDFSGKDPMFLKLTDPLKQELILQMLRSNMNCPLSSGAGRLFDAVAALTGICPVSLFHAEAPMRLEAAIKPGCKGKYHVDYIGKHIVFQAMFHQILSDMEHHVSTAEISAKFHNTIASVILAVSKKLREETGITKVVLSGGSFQNRYLLGLAEVILREQKFSVFAHSKIPSNDGGISLGQMAIAAKRRSSGLIYKPF